MFQDRFQGLPALHGWGAFSFQDRGVSSCHPLARKGDLGAAMPNVPPKFGQCLLGSCRGGVVPPRQGDVKGGEVCRGLVLGAWLRLIEPCHRSASTITTRLSRVI